MTDRMYFTILIATLVSIGTAVGVLSAKRVTEQDRLTCLDMGYEQTVRERTGPHLFCLDKDGRFIRPSLDLR